jgi:hypothetical protein
MILLNSMRRRELSSHHLLLKRRYVKQYLKWNIIKVQVEWVHCWVLSKVLVCH